MAVQQPQLDGMTLRVTADTHSEVVAQIANGPAPKVGQNEPFVVSSSDNEKKQETQRQAWTLDDDDRPEGEHEATAYWWKAEAPLLDDSVDADVLAIFDCCFASDVKGCQDSRRIYDLLAACPKGAFTPAPGPESFSRRLVETLNRLLDEDADQRILTTRLLEEMNMRYHTPAKLHDRLHKDDGRHVQLRPISGQSKQKTEKDAKNFSLRPMEEAGLTI
ncbi:hypothetical protein N0V86_008517 [Didymella sp. IMI 355093]|nr:hypothetical protein N0V86_008517 [Didymella sp. IMI 355093]